MLYNIYSLQHSLQIMIVFQKLIKSFYVRAYSKKLKLWLMLILVESLIRELKKTLTITKSCGLVLSVLPSTLHSYIDRYTSYVILDSDVE